MGCPNPVEVKIAIGNKLKINVNRIFLEGFEDIKNWWGHLFF